MELEFDKEIDALMRKGGVAVGGSPAGWHPDADEIAAFAENAMPERSRALYMGHIADCDRCRGILSNLIVLNAEAEPEKAAAAPVSAPAASEAPWYRKLFLFPNLAYVMGGLVLVMGGLIGLSVLQGSLGGGSATVSQMDESESVRGPMSQTEPGFSANANRSSNAANVMANAATSVNSNAAIASAPSGSANASSASTTNNAAQNRSEVAASAPAPSSADLALTDTAKPAQPTAASPPPPAMMEAAPKDAELAKEDDAKARMVAQEGEKRKAAARTAKKSEEFSVDGRQAQNLPRTQAGGVAKSTPGPTRDMQQNFPNRADNTYELKSQRVSGKDFQFRNGAWYDTAYKGQPTINVRRGTDEYKRLDSGVRSVAERLSGVVVVVSGAKAYRIQ